MVGDMYNAADALQQDFEPILAEGRASSPYVRVFRGTSVQGYAPGTMTVVSGRTSVRIRTQVKITNPNLFLADNLGLTNPVSWAWELIPLSFVANWFVNVDQVVRSWTDTAGVVHSRPEVTTYTRGSATHNWVDKNLQNWFRGSSVFNYARRQTTMPTDPSLAFQLPGRLSWSRAATAMSLLVAMFTRG
jgi:hypothetical protein